MPGYASIFPIVGQQPPTIAVPSTTQNHPLGFRTLAYDTNGAFGAGEFVYAKAAQAIAQTGRLCYLDFDGTAVDVPNTANTGNGIVAACAPMAINTFGWFQASGLIPVQTAASVAAGVAVGLGGVGQAGANSAGKQLLGARVVKASTYAVTKAGKLTNGGKIIQVPDQAWLFPGVVVSGTGVGVGSVITALDPSGTGITVDLAATAAGPSNLTFTYTGFLLISAPVGLFVQGAIT